VSGFQLGDRVADMTVVGSNATYRTLRASDLTRVLAGVDAAEAAALILSWTTAYQLLHRTARVQRGQQVLVQGAAGALGQALIVLGRMTGVELWGTARSTHAALIRELGATPIDYQHQDFTRALLGGFDFVFDGVGEDSYRRSGAAPPARHIDVDCARIPVEALVELAARWQASQHLLDQFDASATSRLVPARPCAAIRPVGGRQHPSARRQADLVR